MFVARRPDNTIYGIWVNRQWEGQEELAEDHPDILAFHVARAARTQPKPAPATLQDRIAEIERRLGIQYV